MNDWELLRQYVQDSSQAAFAALVERHLGLVYSAARRQVRSREMAEDVAQTVFIALARKAGNLRQEASLASWLYAVARTTALEALRKEVRLAERSQTALELSAMNTPSDWSRIEPLLDEAVSALPEEDRSAIVLRYFENKSLREIGATLGASENAAQKRVGRALEQLRSYFLKRGVTVSAASLAADLSAHAIDAAAPPGLAASILAGAAGAGIASEVTLATTGLLATMTTGKLLSTSALALLAALGIGFFAYEYRDWKQASVSAVNDTEDAATRRRIEAATGEIAGLRQVLADATAKGEAAAKALASAVPADAGLAKTGDYVAADALNAATRFSYADTLAKLGLAPEVEKKLVNLLSIFDGRAFSNASSAWRFGQYDPALTRTIQETVTRDEITAIRQLVGDQALAMILNARYDSPEVRTRDMVFRLSSQGILSNDKLSDDQANRLVGMLAALAPMEASLAEINGRADLSPAGKVRARIQRAIFQEQGRVFLTPGVLDQAAGFLSPSQLEIFRRQVDQGQKQLDRLQAGAEEKISAVAQP